MADVEVDEWEKVNMEALNLSEAPATVDKPDVPIHATLLDAISIPKERLVALRIEDRLLRFVNTPSERTLETPPASNSFQRLLIYRVAERFCLDHMTSNVIRENGQRGICLYRTMNTCVPSILLIDLCNSNNYNHQSSTQSEEYPPIGSNDGNAKKAQQQQYNQYQQQLQVQQSLYAPPIQQPWDEPNSYVAAAPAPKVMAVMKRNNSGPDLNKRGSSSGNRNKQSAEEQEQKYAAARARIFGVSAEGTVAAAAPTVGDSCGATTTTGPKSPVVPPAPPAAAATAAVEPLPVKGSPVVTLDAYPSLQAHPSTDSLASNGSEEVYEDRDGRSVVNATSWKGKRSTVRNKQAELSDPDFARRSALEGRGAAGSNAYPPAYPANPNQYYPPQAQVQHQYSQYNAGQPPVAPHLNANLPPMGGISSHHQGGIDPYHTNQSYYGNNPPSYYQNGPNPNGQFPPQGGPPSPHRMQHAASTQAPPNMSSMSQFPSLGSSGPALAPVGPVGVAPGRHASPGVDASISLDMGRAPEHSVPTAAPAPAPAHTTAPISVTPAAVTPVAVTPVAVTPVAVTPVAVTSVATTSAGTKGEAGDNSEKTNSRRRGKNAKNNNSNATNSQKSKKGAT